MELLTATAVEMSDEDSEDVVRLARSQKLWQRYGRPHRVVYIQLG